jgi:hypothetical protein
MAFLAPLEVFLLTGFKEVASSLLALVFGQ